ncbi:uncharacterized protein [Pagrus major]|uniref:uncharacterized protein n=1 Tax=Pagrus major TaxID=143350 RepID=UPI003CC8A9A5
MILLLVTICCALFGSSAGVEYKDMCYGKSLRFPFRYTPPLFRGQLYFTPSDGGPRKLLLDDGKVKEPRIKINTAVGVTLTDLRESDAGTFSESSDGKTNKLITLQILDCATEITNTYGARHTFSIPSQAEYLEFTPLNTDQTKVLWDRNDPQVSKGGRRKMKPGGWEIISLTTDDSGYYNFRKKDNTLLSRIRLTVEESFKHYDTNVNERLFIKNPIEGYPWTVTFTPEDNFRKSTLMEEGNLVTDWTLMNFSGRIENLSDGIEIDPVEIIDSGIFEFTDLEGNLALVATVTVNPELTPIYVYVAIIGGIVLAVFVCCCCVRKCCCKKSSSKRDESAPAAVYYHSQAQDQPAGPSYSAAPAPNYSYQPVNPPASRQPAATSVGPSVHNPVNIHVNPLQPEVYKPVNIHVNPLQPEVSAPAPSLGSDCLSSAPPPEFKLKGCTFPSVPPLSSESTFSDVYTSDKFNFL